MRTRIAIAILVFGLALVTTAWFGFINRDKPNADCSGLCVEEVTDGDTIVLTDGTTVRLIGIDTPESVDPDQPVQCGAIAAKDWMTEHVLDQPVVLKYDQERTDDYDRTLAYVYVNGTFINAELAKEGLARYFDYPPNTSHAPAFHKLVYEAIDQDIGLWHDCPDAMAWASS